MENEDTTPPVIREDLVLVATETRSSGPTQEDKDRETRLNEIRARMDAVVEEEKDTKPAPIEGPVDPRLVSMATGAPVEKILELQALPPPPKEGFTGDPEIDRLYEDCIRCFAEKGAEYTVGSKDRLANFRGVAEDVDVPMEKVWYTFFNKHLRALQSYIKNGCTVKSNEPIQSRIMDLIVYLTLFHKMSLEIERKRLEAARAEHGVIS